MKWEQYDGNSIKVKQSKTGAFIEVKCSEDLKGWLDSERKDTGYILVSETTGTRYMGNNFQNIFGEIRGKTEIGDFWFMDLRRTAVVRLAEAGCTIPKIAAITGHSIETCQKILEVYLPRNAVMAANAIDKLERHRAAAKNDQ